MFFDYSKAIEYGSDMFGVASWLIKVLNSGLLDEVKGLPDEVKGLPDEVERLRDSGLTSSNNSMNMLTSAFSLSLISLIGQVSSLILCFMIQKSS